MNHSRWKHFLGGALIAMVNCTTAHAGDLFLYAAIQLPSQPKYAEAWAEVITTQEQWQAFYTKNFTGGLIDPPRTITAPSIDFNSYRVVVGGLGLKPTGGYSLAVGGVFELSNEIYMDVLDVSLGLDGQPCVVTMGLTYPYIALLLKKSDKPIRVRVVKAMTGCN